MNDLIDIHLDSVDSTNTYAKNQSKTFDPAKVTCITAEEQTAGRGRFQRSWVSPRGTNIYTTFYFQLPPNTLHLISLGQVMTFSLATVLLNENLHPKIKWPNDIQLNEKKISGILCETRFHQYFVELFLGVGINVNMSSDALAKIDKPATSLQKETGRLWDRGKLLKSLQNQFLSDLQKFKKEGFSPFRNQFENLLNYKGKTIRCFDGKKEWVGICHSLSNDGQLNLYLPDQTIHTILSGDVY